MQLEATEKFGNKHYVVSDYDVPEGDKADQLILLTFYKLSGITGVPSNWRSSDPTDHPSVPDRGSGSTILTLVLDSKTIYVPDARFRVPGLSGRVQSKLENTALPRYRRDEGLQR